MVRELKKRKTAKKNIKWPGEYKQRCTVPKEDRVRLGYYIEERDREKFQKIKKPAIIKKKSISAVDRALAKQARARNYFKRKEQLASAGTGIEIIRVPEVIRPKRRSERPVSLAVAMSFKLVTHHLRVIDSTKRIILEVFPGVLSEVETQELATSSKLLFLNSIARSDREDTRHMGAWPDYQQYFFYTKETREFVESTNFLENANTSKVVNKLNNHLRQHFNHLYDKYKSIEMPLEMRLVGRAFPTAAINRGSSTPHYDNFDCKKGLCYVVPYGSFEGGELIFRDLKLRIQCKAGDVVAFDSEGLYHENLPVKGGERFSLVMFCHQHCFDIAPQEKIISS